MDSVAQRVGVVVLWEGGEHTMMAAVGEGTVTTTVGVVGSESEPLGGVGGYSLEYV